MLSGNIGLKCKHITQGRHRQNPHSFIIHSKLLTKLRNNGIEESRARAVQLYNEIVRCFDIIEFLILILIRPMLRDYVGE